MSMNLSHILSKKLKVNELRVKTALREAKKEMAGSKKQETMVEYAKRMSLSNNGVKRPAKTVQKVKEVGKE